MKDQDFWYGSENSSDVTICLIQKKSGAVAEVKGGGGSGKNRKRKREKESLNCPVYLAAIHVHSDRLRACSRYFATCLSERWSKGREPLVEFSLEAQTHVEYYKDCFSRMYSPALKKIPDVEHGIELLKVASQIVFQEVLDACVCYLSSVPWSDDDESMIRKFHSSVYYPSDCARDLTARLGLGHEANEDSYTKMIGMAQECLLKSLTTALLTLDGDLSGPPTYNMDVFVETFQSIMAGTCYPLKEYALSLVRESVVDALTLMLDDPEEEIAGGELVEICWLYRVLKEVGASKEIVQLLIEDDDSLSGQLKEQYAQLEVVNGYLTAGWELEWALTMLDIFEELVTGDLLLKTWERIALFQNWKWILEYTKTECKESADRARNAANSLVMTLPQDRQKDIYESWLDIYRNGKPTLDLRFAHSMWMKILQKDLTALEPTSAASYPVVELADTP